MRRQIMAKLAFVMMITPLGSLARRMPVSAQGSGYAEYFTNPTLSGGPALTHYETGLNHDWGTGSPGNNIPADGFSARFTRRLLRERDLPLHPPVRRGLRVWINDVDHRPLDRPGGARVQRITSSRVASTVYVLRRALGYSAAADRLGATAE